jgi:hypothetical protein
MPVAVNCSVAPTAMVVGVAVIAMETSDGVDGVAELPAGVDPWLPPPPQAVIAIATLAIASDAKRLGVFTSFIIEEPLLIPGGHTPGAAASEESLAEFFERVNVSCHRQRIKRH